MKHVFIALLVCVLTSPFTAASEPPPYAQTNLFREVDFTVGAGQWRLPGTLTLPVAATSKDMPALVLVHGSGPADRDETTGVNKPFRDLAWGLAAKGVAVLRYEKRTREHAAELATMDPTTFTLKEEFVDDALSAAAQLRATKGIDPKRIFVLGHSLGGVAVPRIGQADTNLAGLILLGGCLARPLEDALASTLRYVASLQGTPDKDVQAQLDSLLAQLAKVKSLTAADVKSRDLLIGATPRYWLDLREHDPLAIAKSLKQPFLVLHGDRDYQAPRADFDVWKKAFGSRSNATFKLYPKLNHLFMAGEGKSMPAEYLQPGHMEQAVVDDIAEWILTH